MRSVHRRFAPAPDQHEPVRATPLEITSESVQDSFERMLRRFTKKVRAEGILQEFSAKSRYVKPSVARRMKRAKAAAERRRAEKKI